MNSGKSGCIRAIWLYSGKVVVFGQIGCNLIKVVVFRQRACIRTKVVVFGEIWLHSGKEVVFGQGGCVRSEWLYLGKSGCI